MSFFSVSVIRRVARVGRYGIINPDYLQQWGADFNNAFHVSRPKRNFPSIAVERGLPATGRFAGGERIKFTSDLQWWCHGLSGGTPLTFKSDFDSIWRDAAFMSNDAGTDKCRDYINDTNKDAEDPKIEPMGCAGALLKIMGESSVYYDFEAINAYDNYRQFDPNNPQHRHLFFHPDNSRRELINGKWYEDICIPFSQYANHAIIPIFAHGDSNRNKIEKYRVRILGVDEPVPSPYKTRNGVNYLNPYKDF